MNSPSDRARTNRLAHRLELPVKRLLLNILACVLFTSPALAQKSGRDRVLKIDAVELIDNQKEIEGKTEFQHQFGRYNYLFANAANLETFKANPAKYEIQQGGACGRMGPLSGEGSPKIFAVHDGRLYIFASEQCKRSFLKDPSKVLETEDEPLVTSEQSRAHGRDLIERAMKAIGGAAKLDAIVSYREKRSRETESGGTKYIVTDTTTLLLPDGVANASCWNEQCWGNVVTATDAWSTSSDGAESMVGAQRIALLRSAGRHPLMLLRNRNAADAVVASIGNTRSVNVPGEGMIDVELVFIHRAGATTTLGIDADGHVRWMSYRGRGPTLGIGTLEFIYSAFHDVGGLTLPGRVDVIFDGTPSPEDSGSFAEQSINEASHRAAFQR